MKNVLSYIVIIIAVVALVVVAGFIIGTIAHNIKIKSDYEITKQTVREEESIDSEWKDEQKSQLKLTTSKEDDIKLKEIEKEIVEFNREYEVQLFFSNDSTKVEKIKSELELEGFECDIHTLSTGESIFYRLRLRGLYSKVEGNRVGNEIVEGSSNISSFWLDEFKDEGNTNKVKEIVNEPAKTIKHTPNDEYEIQLLASTKKNFVENRKSILEKAGYNAKVVTTTKNGQTYYRLRLVDSYLESIAKEVGDKLKIEIEFISDYWLVPKSGGNTPESRIVKKEATVNNESLNESSKDSKDPKFQSIDSKQQKMMICNTNDINIHIGPGTYYAIDPIGKLMKGVTIFVVDEKNNWIKFTITPNDESWSGWVDKKYLK